VIVSSSTREDELNCNVKDTQSLMNTQTFVCDRVSEWEVNKKLLVSEMEGQRLQSQNLPHCLTNMAHSYPIWFVSTHTLGLFLEAFKSSKNLQHKLMNCNSSLRSGWACNVLPFRSASPLSLSFRSVVSPWTKHKLTGEEWLSHAEVSRRISWTLRTPSRDSTFTAVKLDWLSATIWTSRSSVSKRKEILVYFCSKVQYNKMKGSWSKKYCWFNLKNEVTWLP